MGTIEVVLGDITAERVDAIVTAANESRLGGGGVDGAIHRAAGPRLAEAGAELAPCEPGKAVATPAFDRETFDALRRSTAAPVEGCGAGWQCTANERHDRTNGERDERRHQVAFKDAIAAALGEDRGWSVP
ncbi:macro domain-containing protein [Lentzea aerocolonigenes]|uniref:macro domain-containing protein n=1 Tax=Lentzea aerocolonigenes TaxID=68170 RepID=UPI000A60DED8|nr:Macro domain-containing protein [Lentzea aerocolonigenes]